MNNGSKVALAQALAQAQVAGATDATALVFVIGRDFTRSRLVKGIEENEDVIYCYPNLRSGRILSGFFGDQSSSDEPVIALTAADLADGAVRQLLDGLEETDMLCRVFPDRRRVPLFSVFHVS